VYFCFDTRGSFRGGVWRSSQAEKAFAASYLESHGRPWSAYWPKAPPSLHMWPAEFVGQVHAVSTPFGPFECPLDRFWLKDWADASSAGAQDGGQAALDACHAAVAAVSPGTNAGRGAAGQKELLIDT
jgi:hypothetical protein